MTATVVIPCYNRPGPLSECLAALNCLDGAPYATIVVDDGSQKDLAPACERAGEHVTLVRQKNAGPGAARNTGVHNAETDLILFLDDDCYPQTDWAIRMITAQAGQEMRLVGGAIVNALKKNPFATASQSILTYAYEAFGTFDGPFAFFTTNNVCCRKEDFLRVGGFDQTFRFASEDRDFSRRWQAAGGHLVHCADAVVDHHHKMSLKSFSRQQWAYGRGARQFHAKLAAEGGPDVSLNDPGFYAGLLLHPLRKPSPRAALTSFLIGVAHAIQLGGYLTERRSERRTGS